MGLQQSYPCQEVREGDGGRTGWKLALPPPVAIFTLQHCRKILLYWFTGLSLAELEVTTSSFWPGTRSVRSQWPADCLPEPSASWDSLMQGPGIWQGLGILQHPSLTRSSLTDSGEGGGKGSWGKGWDVSFSRGSESRSISNTAPRKGVCELPTCGLNHSVTSDSLRPRGL